MSTTIFIMELMLYSLLIFVVCCMAIEKITLIIHKCKLKKAKKCFMKNLEKMFLEEMSKEDEE